MDVKERYCDQFSGQETLKELIKVIDISKENDINLALLKSTKTTRAETLVAVTHLKDNFDTKYQKQIETAFIRISNIKKDQLFNQLITFVQISFPTQCLICESDYTPLYQEESGNGDVECIRCKISAHTTCYKQNDFNINQGKVYMCQVCIQTIGKEDEEKEEVEKKVEVVNSDSSDSSDDSSDDEDEDDDREHWTEVKKKKSGRSPKDSARKKSPKKKSKKKEQICPKLMEGVCPHGASGKECEFTHKKKCNRYINYGTKEMHKGGCRFGEDCYYLHPKMCQNSATLNTCYNESCKLVHLRFTKRRPTRSDNRVSNGESNRNYQGSNSFQNPRSYEQRQSKPHEYSSYNQQNRWANKNPHYNNAQNPFLEENMLKKMEQRILHSVKQMIATQLWNTEEDYNTEYPQLNGEW